MTTLDGEYIKTNANQGLITEGSIAVSGGSYVQGSPSNINKSDSGVGNGTQALTGKGTVVGYGVNYGINIASAESGVKLVGIIKSDKP